MSGLRVCFVGTHAADASRYPSASQTVAAALSERGFDTHLTSTATGRLERLRDIRRTVSRGRDAFDVIVIDTFSTRALWYARMASRLAARQQVPAIAVLHGGNLPAVARDRPRRLRPHLDRVAHVVAPSRYLAREVGERLGVSVSVIPNPVPTDTIDGRVRPLAQPRLLWARAFGAEYRPADALRLLAELPDATLVMAGPDRDGSEAVCRALATELGVEDRVRFTGLVTKSHLGQLASEADIFLNTTSVDNVPVSVIEAMAGGLCLVSTSAGGLADIVDDGRTGLLVPVGDVQRMAQAVRRLVADTALATRISAAAREAARAYDTTRVADAWQALLRDVAIGRA